MITDSNLNELLLRIQSAPNETLISRRVCFEGMCPGDEPDERWKDLSDTDGPALRAAIRIGLVSETYRSWEPDWPEEHVPDGGDYFVTLTGTGTERLLRLNEPGWRRALRQVAANIPTILVSVVGALLSGWVIYYFGAPK